MFTRAIFAILVVFGCLAGCAGASAANTPPAPAGAPDSAASHSTRGLVRSFGPDRAYVSIAHEAIPGSMAAMTMSFEPREPSQIAGLVVGDKVAFTFVEQDDGRRIIERITKE